MREPWAWLKQYRVWEAVRKVLLYAENWLQPEQPDDQSSSEAPRGDEKAPLRKEPPVRRR